MSMYDRKLIQDGRAVTTFSSRVYGWMAFGLCFTATIAFFLYKTGLYLALAPFWWVWAFATLGVAMGINVGIQRFSVGTVAALFLTYAGLEGILFGTILPLFAANYGGQVIWSAFLTGGCIFAAAMGYGLLTKNDLTSLGRILSFALIGLIGLSLVYLVLSFFVTLTWANLMISYLGLIIFVGLTAYDAQSIRQMSHQADVGSALSYKLSLVMALRMYLNVIMIFWYLLQIFSSSSKR